MFIDRNGPPSSAVRRGRRTVRFKKGKLIPAPSHGAGRLLLLMGCAVELLLIHQPLTFFDSQNSVRANASKFIDGTAGPAHFYQSYF